VAALKKLNLKREPLVKAARDLAEKGVEWDAKDLPRSFAKTDSAAHAEALPASENASDAR